MAQPQIPLNFTPVTPSLADLLNSLKKDIFLSMSCHHIATIQSFDSVNQTVTATVNYTKTFYQLDQDTGIYNPTQVSYPILLDCPAIILGGGNAALTLPIQKGDECIILFNDRDIDNWFSGASAGPVASSRLHSFSDGIALIGLRNSNRSLTNYDITRAVLRNGTTLVGVGANLIKIANATTTLNTLLQNLISAIEALTVTCPSGGGPSSPPLNSATFSTIATELGGLLE